MSINENDFLSDDIIGGDAPSKPYVPRFEKDLQKAGGDLSTLAQQKTEEQKPAAETPVPAQEYAEPSAFESEQVDYDEAALDYVYDDDENYSYTGALEDISVDSIALDDMDVKLEEMRNEKSATASSLKNQMMADDLAMSVDTNLKLNEMSDEYGPSKKKNEDLLNKSKLDRDEKEIIKNRLRSELEAKSEGYDKKKSAEMYRKLMAEQHAREAKKGLGQLVITAVIGLLTAACVFVLDSKAPEAKGLIPSLMPLAIAAAVFSLGMFIKTSFFKIMSVLFFILNAIALIGPGLVVYAMNPDNQSGDTYIIGIVLTAAAVIFSTLTAFRLVTNKDIKNYYSYKPEKKRK